MRRSYPYLTSVNSVLPALIAGNAVLLKPSPQTPLSGERFVSTLHAAGFPPDLVQVHHLSPALTARAVQHPLVSFVSFTGSVAGGRAVERAAAAADGPFKGVALELGGKDPAYVRADAALSTALPPATEPVKETKETSGCCTARAVSAGERWCTWTRSRGKPAACRVDTKRSPDKGVCGEGLSSTALPAIRAGRTELTEVRYG
jgi:acyl-CoA reductase-like NAD-dependent aldehyde dehydrogenase